MMRYTKEISRYIFIILYNFINYLYHNLEQFGEIYNELYEL